MTHEFEHVVTNDGDVFVGVAGLGNYTITIQHQRPGKEDYYTYATAKIFEETENEWLGIVGDGDLVRLKKNERGYGEQGEIRQMVPGTGDVYYSKFRPVRVVLRKHDAGPDNADSKVIRWRLVPCPGPRALIAVQAQRGGCEWGTIGHFISSGGRVRFEERQHGEPLPDWYTGNWENVVTFTPLWDPLEHLLPKDINPFEVQTGDQKEAGDKQTKSPPNDPLAFLGAAFERNKDVREAHYKKVNEYLNDKQRPISHHGFYYESGGGDFCRDFEKDEAKQRHNPTEPGAYWGQVAGESERVPLILTDINWSGWVGYAIYKDRFCAVQGHCELSLGLMTYKEAGNCYSIAINITEPRAVTNDNAPSRPGKYWIKYFDTSSGKYRVTGVRLNMDPAGQYNSWTGKVHDTNGRLWSLIIPEYRLYRLGGMMARPDGTGAVAYGTFQVMGPMFLLHPDGGGEYDNIEAKPVFTMPPIPITEEE